MRTGELPRSLLAALLLCLHQPRSLWRPHSKVQSHLRLRSSPPSPRRSLVRKCTRPITVATLPGTCASGNYAASLDVQGSRRTAGPASAALEGVSQPASAPCPAKKSFHPARGPSPKRASAFGVLTPPHSFAGPGTALGPPGAAQ